jgi:hypothetical protein
MTLHLEDIQEARESELSTRAVAGRHQLLERVRRGAQAELRRMAVN